MANKELPTLNDVSRIPEELIPVVQWWQDKGPKTMAIVGGAVAVAAAILLYGANRQSTQNDAIVALNLAAEAADYEAIAASGTDAAAAAQLPLARSLYNAGDYEKALAAYDAALADVDDPALYDIATLGRACALEALGRFDEALAMIKTLETQFTAEGPVHFLTSETLLAKARILCQQGDKAAAKEVLKPLLEAAEDSVLGKYKPQAERTAKIIDAYVKQSLFEKADAMAPAETK